jgi:thiol:disulfide interchange protein DsbD
MYGAGVLASFIGLAVLAVLVQHLGGLASWGMVLQNQVCRAILTIVITLVALNLFGLFEVTMNGQVMSVAGHWASKSGTAGAFFNGVLATILATPCTAPFLGAALAFAFLQPPLIILLVFSAAGMGLAFPFVVVCLRPGWTRWLPKPGAWMEQFKKAMGFPMLATAVWLFWFTAPRYGKSGVLWFGLFLVLIAAVCWGWGEFVQRGARRRGLAATLAIGFLVVGYLYALEHQLKWRHPSAVTFDLHGRRTSGGLAWEPWSPEAVAAARAAGHPVLVDFTADNCLNCQLNKRTSLDTSVTRAALESINGKAFLADFTDRDERIAMELRRYNRAGVPLVLVYSADSTTPPTILPPILTQAMVRNALEQHPARPLRQGPAR